MTPRRRSYEAFTKYGSVVHLNEIVRKSCDVETQIRTARAFPAAHVAGNLRRAEVDAGFSDARLSTLLSRHKGKRGSRRYAQELGLHAGIYKRIDTCAAEFFGDHAPTCMRPMKRPFGGMRGMRRVKANRQRRRSSSLGGGPNRIGQGIEFDYCCCHACVRSLSKSGFETIMVNCNPETVSTDYDTSDRLYFEPLTAEDVLEIVRKSNRSKGTLARASLSSLAAQTPLKLANRSGPKEGASRYWVHLPIRYRSRRRSQTLSSVLLDKIWT